MLGGFKWHSNGGGGGRLKGGFVTQVPQGSHCTARGTQRNHHKLHLLARALHLPAELRGGTLVPGLELDLIPTFFFFFFPDTPLNMSILPDGGCTLPSLERHW